MPKTAEVQFAQDCSYTVLKDSICPRYSWTKDQKHEPHISKLVVVFRFPSSSLPTLLIYLTYKQFPVYNLCDSEILAGGGEHSVSDCFFSSDNIGQYKK